MSAYHRLSDLPNLGPKSEAMLAAIGVHDRADLTSRDVVRDDRLRLLLELETHGDKSQ